MDSPPINKGPAMTRIETWNATEFKAKCLKILKRISARELDRVVVTKRGRPLAVLTPTPSDAAAVEPIHGFMRGSVIFSEGVDLTEAVGEGCF
jgi:prevent-host-death family protein